MIRRAIAAVAAAALLGGCAPIPTRADRPRPPFPEAEYAALSLEGHNTVTGQGFLRTRGGDVKFAAGSQVVLMPVTTYSEHWYRHFYALGEVLEPADGRHDRYVREVQADGSGRFKFRAVPPGAYFIGTTVTWEVPIFRGGTDPQGGWIIKRIKVIDGEDLEVMITR